MKKQAFTLVEVLCVIVILSILSAILFPVFASAKMASKVGAAKQNLHGFWLGLKIYQADHEEKVEFGPAEEMGLPLASDDWFNYVKDYTKNYSSGWAEKQQYLPCGLSLTEDDWEGLGYMPLNLTDFPRDILKYENDTVILFDKNCNARGTRITCQFCRKRSIGITLGGAIRDRTNSEWLTDNQKFYR